MAFISQGNASTPTPSAGGSGASATQQVIETLPASMSDYNTTSARHSHFGTLYLNDEPIGGMQNFNIREQNGTVFIPQAGNDWLEPQFGMRFWSGTGRRFQVRGKDIAEILQLSNTDVHDMDFRFLPFDLRWHFLFKSASGRTSFEDLTIHYHTVLITDYQWSFESANSLVMDDFTFIGKGYGRADSGAQGMSTPTYLWGGSKTVNVTRAIAA